MHDPSPLRFGVVSYANVAPLVDGLPAADVRRGVPSRVAAWLASGEVDVALVPAIELGRLAGVKAVPRWGIGADGRCDSVLLFSRMPLSEVRRLALDAASRTSSVLARVVLRLAGARDVEAFDVEGGSVAERLAGADATLLIGDPALRAEAPPGVGVVDLGLEWQQRTGLPFVFACWASRGGRELTSHELRLLDEAAERGLARLPALAAQEAERTGIPLERMERYLRGLAYRLDERHRAGLQRFLDEAASAGLLERRAEVAYYP